MKSPAGDKTVAVPRRSLLTVALGAPALLSEISHPAAQEATQSLPPRNDGPAKQAILDFLRATTDQLSKSFVRPEDRIATFDQDGTLWVEHPIYTQAMFALDRIHSIATRHPEWKGREPFKACSATIWLRLSGSRKPIGRKSSLLRTVA